MTTTYATAHFVAQHRAELIAEAAAYRQIHSRRAWQITAHVRSAFRTWYAAGEL